MIQNRHRIMELEISLEFPSQQRLLHKWRPTTTSRMQRVVRPTHLDERQQFPEQEIVPEIVGGVRDLIPIGRRPLRNLRIGSKFGECVIGRLLGGPPLFDPFFCHDSHETIGRQRFWTVTKLVLTSTYCTILSTTIHVGTRSFQRKWGARMSVSWAVPQWDAGGSPPSGTGQRSQQRSAGSCSS